MEQIAISNMALTIMTNNDLLIQNQVFKYQHGIEQVKQNMNNHYDQARINLDLRIEKLIVYLHDSSDILRQEIENCRIKTNEEIMKSESLYDNFFGEMTSIINTNKKSEIIYLSNCLELQIKQLELKRWNFVENDFKLDKSILGYNLQISVHFFKIKNLQTLKQQAKLVINLNSNFHLSIIDFRVIAMNNSCFIKCYLTSENRVFFELFDQSGISKKIVVLKQKSILIPNIVSNSYFCAFSFDSLVDNNNVQHFLSIFDCNLNKIKSIREINSIESLYINESILICSYLNASSNCCNVFDLNLTLVTSFGQKFNEYSEFFIRKNDHPFSENGRLLCNPLIFGYSEEHIYFYNKLCIIIMCSKTGTLLRQIQRTCQTSTLMIDKNSNILEFSLLGNYVKLYNLEKNMCITGNYIGLYSEICFLENKYFAFVSQDKKNIIIV